MEKQLEILSLEIGKLTIEPGDILVLRDRQAQTSKKQEYELIETVNSLCECKCLFIKGDIEIEKLSQRTSL